MRELLSKHATNEDKYNQGSGVKSKVGELIMPLKIEPGKYFGNVEFAQGKYSYCNDRTQQPKIDRRRGLSAKVK